MVFSLHQNILLELVCHIYSLVKSLVLGLAIVYALGLCLDFIALLLSLCLAGVGGCQMLTWSCSHKILVSLLYFETLLCFILLWNFQCFFSVMIGLWNIVVSAVIELWNVVFQFYWTMECSFQIWCVPSSFHFRLRIMFHMICFINFVFYFSITRT